jgi:hypothetical protein
MKRIMFLTCIGSFALALTALGAPRDRGGRGSVHGGGAPGAHTISGRGGGHFAPMRGGGHMIGHAAPMRASGRSSMGRVRPSGVTRVNTLRGSRMEAARIGARNRVAVNRGRNFTRANTLRTNREAAARMRSFRTAQAKARTGARSNLALNKGKNLTLGRNVAVNGAKNVGIVNNWHTNRFSGSNYSAFYNYTPQWHDRIWWRNHYSRIIFVLGGWWYWDAGYWYPCWGYDPYAYYWYDGPIYGYANLTPYQIIVNVQIQLQNDGYYAGPIDGILGSQTREALAAFQADNGLVVTSAVDRPTIQALGIA